MHLLLKKVAPLVFFDDRLGYDGAFFAKAGNSVLVDLECPANEFLTGVKNGEAQCTPIVTGEGGGAPSTCAGGCGCNNVCVAGICVEAAVSKCK